MNNPILDSETARRLRKQSLVANGLLALAGWGIATVVYFFFAIPSEIIFDRLDKFGEPVGPESTLLYLFVFPCAQLWLLVMPLLGQRRPAMTASTKELIVRILTRHVRSTPLSVEFYRIILVLLTIFSGLFLVGTIYRSFFLLLVSNK